MARQEADREDLFAEAVALNRRIEGTLVTTGELVVAGFRSTGWLSVYLAADPMYQVDEQGRLRRAYERNVLYRSQGTTLAAMVRDRAPTETTLVRRDLANSELNAFRERMIDRLSGLIAALEAGGFQLQRQEPADDASLRADIVTLLRTALQAELWLAPAIVKR